MSLRKNFIERWKDRGTERGETQVFWLELLRDVFGIVNPANYIRFENPARTDPKNFLNGYIDATHVMIEQKSRDKDLSESLKQADGSLVTPYQQLKRYAAKFPPAKRPHKIIVCNFKEFHIYDIENSETVPETVLLENLDSDYLRLKFIIDEDYIRLQQEFVNAIQAGKIISKLHKVLNTECVDTYDEKILHNMDKLCVWIALCLYSEMVGIFSKQQIFREYIIASRNLKVSLEDFIKVLRTPVKERDPQTDPAIKILPYVNGDLFDTGVEIPKFSEPIRQMLFDSLVANFNWRNLSPAIFGALFAATLRPVSRKDSSMHYVSIENIHKVIDPLFLDDLRGEFKTCETVEELLAFQDKLASLKFLDPACQGGNFLAEIYVSMRRLENEILKKLIEKQMPITDVKSLVKVSLAQFYAIDASDISAAITKVTLWIAELQMIIETSTLINRNIAFLPLKSRANITVGDALQLDWKDVIPEVNYIISNPPTEPPKGQTAENKIKVAAVNKALRSLDYVAGWYYKAVQFMQDTTTRAVFSTTCSIAQGEQAALLWKNLDAHIDFARRFFKWDSEPNLRNHFYNVIVGFSVAPNDKPKIIYTSRKNIIAEHINGYLIDAPDVFIVKRKTPLCDAPPMVYGSKPADGGNFMLDKKARATLIAETPAIEPYIKQYMGADNLLSKEVRYCLWLKDCPEDILNSSEEVRRRMEDVRKFRLKSRKHDTRRLSAYPNRFMEIRQSPTDYIALPVVSASDKRYIPMKIVNKEIIASANTHMVLTSDMYTFGILNSIVHNAWVRVVGTKMGTKTVYAATIAYNDFPWCTPTDEQRQRIEDTAKGILNAREIHSNIPLGDLYENNKMPVELRRAHVLNDRAVMDAYGFNYDMVEGEIVAALMKLYIKLVEAETN